MPPVDSRRLTSAVLKDSPSEMLSLNRKLSSVRDEVASRSPGNGLEVSSGDGVLPGVWLPLSPPSWDRSSIKPPDFPTTQGLAEAQEDGVSSSEATSPLSRLSTERASPTLKRSSSRRLPPLPARARLSSGSSRRPAPEWRLRSRLQALMVSAARCGWEPSLRRCFTRPLADEEAFAGPGPDLVEEAADQRGRDVELREEQRQAGVARLPQPQPLLILLVDAVAAQHALEQLRGRRRDGTFELEAPPSRIRVAGVGAAGLEEEQEELVPGRAGLEEAEQQLQQPAQLQADTAINTSTRV
ncbi:hypothetical protein EYF80_034111 [Liparis tanakae]|uniref:Uncharacterized protein n=1 Tax=Liparis tanakae TaxID=230148 RepID=A0A4Z2GQD8_9TELE|nr:hypothetical protein EYF80_034111 [Liparis tanakae]